MGRECLMPICRLLASTHFFEDDLGKPVGKRTPSKGSLDARMPELLGRDREAKLQKPYIGGGIALIDMPAAKDAFVGIAVVAPLKRPEPVCQTILGWPVIKIQTFFPCTGAQIKLDQATRTDRGISHRVKAGV